MTKGESAYTSCDSVCYYGYSERPQINTWAMLPVPRHHICGMSSLTLPSFASLLMKIDLAYSFLS